MGAKLELVHGLSVEDAVEAVNRIENSVRQAVPTARIMYLEPDIFRTSLPSDEAKPLAAGTVLTGAPADGLAVAEIPADEGADGAAAEAPAGRCAGPGRDPRRRSHQSE